MRCFWLLLEETWQGGHQPAGVVAPAGHRCWEAQPCPRSCCPPWKIKSIPVGPTSLLSARWRPTPDAEGTRPWCCPASGRDTGRSEECAGERRVPGLCGDLKALFWGPQSLVLGTSTAHTPSLSWRSAGECGGERARMNFITGSTTSTIPN